MTTQEIVTYAIGALALGYLGWRFARRRLSGNCCGETECPAAKEMLDRLDG